jgi:hypothetical protein
MQIRSTVHYVLLIRQHISGAADAMDSNSHRTALFCSSTCGGRISRARLLAIYDSDLTERCLLYQQLYSNDDSSLIARRLRPERRYRALAASARDAHHEESAGRAQTTSPDADSLIWRTGRRCYRASMNTCVRCS